MQKINITSIDEGQRLDKLLAKFMPEAPKSFFYKMMRKKNIVLNGKKTTGAERVVAGDEIKLFLADDTIEKFKGKTIVSDEVCITDLDIVFEDEDILVINKPVGMLSQKAQKDDISVVEYITEYLVQKNVLQLSAGNTFKPGICNRLDRNTSGLIVAGKSVRGLQWMNSLFRDRNLKKFYLCIVKGRVDRKERIDGYLEKNENHNTVTITDDYVSGSHRIITEYEPMGYGRMNGNEYTLLKVHLITGKSHQIRAHLKSIGHPIVGDAKYGHKDVYKEFRKEFNLRYQLLHAWTLEIDDTEDTPEKYRNMKFVAPVPEQFCKIATAIGIKMP